VGVARVGQPLSGVHAQVLARSSGKVRVLQFDAAWEAPRAWLWGENLTPGSSWDLSLFHDALSSNVENQSSCFRKDARWFK
jgi:hypothetical protein